MVSPIICAVCAVLYLRSRFDFPDIATVALILFGVATGLCGGGRLIWKVTKPETKREEDDNESE